METNPGPPSTGRDRLVSALLLFLPLALWPAAAAVSAWREGATPSFVLAMVGVALAAIPAGATALGFGWAKKLTEAFALAGMAVGILYVLRNGISLLAVPAVGYFVVYAFLSHERFRTGGAGKSEAAADHPPPEHPLAWLKENVEAIAVAFIMALVIRCFCVEVFKIPSSSMEPTLLGDNPHEGRGGDRIMVTKLTYWLQGVARFEPVVFKFPLNPMKNYIKRVVGLPGELFMLFRGNVYTIPDGSADKTFRIQRKTLRTQRSLWIRSWRETRPLLQSQDIFKEHFRPEGQAATTLRDGILAGSGTGAAGWNNRKNIDDGHLGDSRHNPVNVNDVLFECDLTLQNGTGGFWIRLEHDFGPFLLKLRPSGGSVLERAGKKLPLKTAAFPVGTSVHVEFMVFDGQVFVLFDGRIQAELVFHEKLDEAENRTNENGLGFGAEGVPFALSKLRIAQDIHYKPKEDGHAMSRHNPLPIPAGNYFMLGDNVNNSHDGRAWKKHTVVMSDGRVIEFESQSKNDKGKDSWAKRHGKEELPYIYVDADINGQEQGIYWPDIAPNGEKQPEPLYFVEGRLIIGRALAVCWPLSRSFKLIR